MAGRYDNVFLIGPMGSGKTSIGRRVAQRLGLDFFDCDLELENRTGASISLIFDIEGEEGFRRREACLLKELSRGSKRLISTGGGVVLDPANRSCMRDNGMVVYLQTSVDHQIERLRRDRQRPLIQSPDRRERLQQLAMERNLLYEETAHLIIPSENRSLRRMTRKACTAIERAIQERKAS